MIIWEPNFLKWVDQYPHRCFYGPRISCATSSMVGKSKALLFPCITVGLSSTPTFYPTLAYQRSPGLVAWCCADAANEGGEGLSLLGPPVMCSTFWGEGTASTSPEKMLRCHSELLSLRIAAWRQWRAPCDLILTQERKGDFFFLSAQLVLSLCL